MAAWFGLAISAAAVVFGFLQVRRGDRRGGRLAIGLGVVGVVFNLYALLRGM